MELDLGSFDGEIFFINRCDQVCGKLARPREPYGERFMFQALENLVIFWFFSLTA